MGLDALAQEDLDVNLDVGELEAILRNIAGSKAVETLERSYAATLVRAIEISLLSNPRMLSLIRAPGVYLGREEAEVRTILSDLGLGTASVEVVNFLIETIRGRIAHAITKRSADLYLRDVLVQYYGGGQEFRCLDCGYYFRSGDMGESRRELVTELGISTATSTPPERFRDPWKVATDEYRQLTIDHIRPEAALGPTVRQNLRIICGFCNKRRQIARRQPEVLASRVSSGLLAVVGGSRGQWALESSVYFAICEGRVCGECLADATAAELTALPLGRNPRWTGILPWQLEVRCYTHSGY